MQFKKKKYNISRHSTKKHTDPALQTEVFIRMWTVVPLNREESGWMQKIMQDLAKLRAPSSPKNGANTDGWMDKKWKGQ